jgi:hypothetical protein
MSETVSGMLGYVHSERNGSTWLKPASGTATGVIPTDDATIYNRTGIFPYHLMDRKRDKMRLLADWVPADRFSVQFSADYGEDDYSGPTEKGLDRSKLALLGIDAAYTLSEDVKLTAYYSYSEQGMRISHSTGYIADLKDNNSTFGVGAIWRVSPKLRLGADVLYIDDRNKYEQILDASGSSTNQAFLASGGGLPDVTYKDTRFKLYGAYALQKNSEVRFDFIYDRQKLNEWTWSNSVNGTPFLYSDNTTVFINPDQKVTYVGITYVYYFR